MGRLCHLRLSPTPWCLHCFLNEGFGVRAGRQEDPQELETPALDIYPEPISKGEQLVPRDILQEKISPARTDVGRAI